MKTVFFEKTLYIEFRVPDDCPTGNTDGLHDEILTYLVDRDLYPSEDDMTCIDLYIEVLQHEKELSPPPDERSHSHATR